ncbi:MAG: hypothetical protein AUG93_00290 [Armatimonadetes bacterium 13_1_20CM_4_65_7]|nr:MAG: hypothetical protein AUG93_00290 [Armatimonadetes bacterium 13_1_20CM_4_65_7]
MSRLDARKRASLPKRAFAYVDSRGRRRLPINDEAHVRNALARFNQVDFENDAARERARKRLLNAAKKYGIVPIGFITGQLHSARAQATHDVRADEFFAVFKHAVDAVEAAAAIQRALGERTRRDELEVRVRIGIHSGRPTLTDFGYIGLPVHTVARVCAVAHGGQIVISGETTEAVGASMPAGLRFRSLGRHRLSGLPDAEALFQVEADGLLATFPPPRTGGRSRRIHDSSRA